MKNQGNCVQEKYAPGSICYSCGPANSKGLHIRSFENASLGTSALEATWTPEPHHEAFPGMLNGGIIGSILDCHCNWTAAMHLMRTRNLEAPPCTVTANYKIDLKRPTPSKAQVILQSKVIDTQGDKVTVEATLTADGKVCATCVGVFVAVREGHPAYHRW